MFCPDELKVNKLVQVDLPKPRDMFANFGYHSVDGSAYAGDSSVEKPISKIDELSRIQNYERKRLAKEESNVD